MPVGTTALRFLESTIRAVRPELAPDPGCRALFVDRCGKRLPYHTLRRIVLRIGNYYGSEVRV